MIFFTTANLGAQAMKWRSATSLPATCTAGTAVTAADAIVVSSVLYICTSTNVWKALFFTDGSQTMTGKLSLTPSTTAAAGFNMGTGSVAPTSPVGGDMWLNGSADLQWWNGSTTRTAERTDRKNAASGYAGLDSGSLLTLSQMPAAVVQTGKANTYGAFAQDFSLASSLIVPTSAGAAPTANGSIAFDSTNSKYVFGGTIGASSTASTGFVPRFFTFLGASTTVTATVTETAFSTSTGSFPAGFFTVGKIAIVYAEVQDVMGGTVATRKYQLRLQKAGPTNVYLYTPATSTPTASTTRSAAMIFFIRCVTTGATGTVDVGMVGTGNTANSVVVNTVAQPVTIDTTAAQTVQLTQTLGATTAGETSQMRFMMLGELN